MCAHAVLHIHNPKELSGIYYVAAGQAQPPGAARTDGCLLFRAGPSIRPDGQANAAHSFMRVEPMAGTLWIFPGGIPHAVMGMEMGMESAAPADMQGDLGWSCGGMEPCLHLEQPSSVETTAATTAAEMQAHYAPFSTRAVARSLASCHRHTKRRAHASSCTSVRGPDPHANQTPWHDPHLAGAA